MNRPKIVPQSITLSRRIYDRLRKLTEWYDATPDYIELDDHTSEHIWDLQARDVPDRRLPGGWGVVSVQIETDETASVHGTLVGAMVALVEPDDGPGLTREVAVTLLRGPR